MLPHGVQERFQQRIGGIFAPDQIDVKFCGDIVDFQHAEVSAAAVTDQRGHEGDPHPGSEL